ncbi:MAG TPA: SseB family protein [Thermomonospora sp.]|nr:SseB family protein [Thermomonospora sp.]
MSGDPATRDTEPLGLTSPPPVGRAEVAEPGADAPGGAPGGPEFQPANDVERGLLRASAAGDQDGYLAALATAEVLLPVPQDMDYALRPGRQGFPWQTREVDGTTVVPVFTSPERMRDVTGEPVAPLGQGGAEFVALPFVAVARYWPDHSWAPAVNPGTPVGATVPGERLKALSEWADQITAQRMAEGFEPQNDIERKLFEAATRRDGDAFFKVLLSAQVLVPADPETPWGIHPGEREFPWRPVPVRGAPAVQVFTSLRWMHETIGPSRFVMPALVEVLAAWPDVEWTLVVNPGTPINAIMPGDRVRALAEIAGPPASDEPAASPAPDDPAVTRPQPIVPATTTAPATPDRLVAGAPDRSPGEPAPGVVAAAARPATPGTTEPGAPEAPSGQASATPPGSPATADAQHLRPASDTTGPGEPDGVPDRAAHEAPASGPAPSAPTGTPEHTATEPAGTLGAPPASAPGAPPTATAPGAPATEAPEGADPQGDWVPARRDAARAQARQPGPEEAPEPEFEPGNRIDQELYEAALAGDTDAFLRVLLAANVLVPIPADAPLEVTPVQPEFRWEAAMRDASSVQVFTSLVRLREALPASRFVYADFRELIGAWPRTDWAMLLNPGTRIGASLLGDQVQALSEWAVRVGLIRPRPPADPTQTLVDPPFGQGAQGPVHAAAGDPTETTVDPVHRGDPTETMVDFGRAPADADPAATVTDPSLLTPGPTGPQAADRFVAGQASPPGEARQADPWAGADPAETVVDPGWRIVDEEPAAQAPNGVPSPFGREPDGDGMPEQPVVFQKVLPHGHVGWYLEQGYDRVGGFVHPVADVTDLQTPAQLYEALGLLYEDSPFSPSDEGVYVIRWPGFCPGLYRIPFGGQTDEDVRAWGDAGWVQERPPFVGTGFAPGSAGSIREYKVDSARLPYGAEMYYLDRNRTERFIAMYDPDRLAWVRPGGDEDDTVADGRPAGDRAEAAQ